MYEPGKLANTLYHILREYARDSVYYLKYSFLMLALKSYSLSFFRIKCNSSRSKFYYILS